jgi:hypothetical protein
MQVKQNTLGNSERQYDIDVAGGGLFLQGIILETGVINT